jgi:hypothetical protein
MRRLLIYLVFGCLIGCRHQYSVFPPGYRYSNNGKDIPQRISDSLLQWHSGDFLLADTFNHLNVTFTDFSSGPIQTDKRLTFLLLNNTKCILVYQEGQPMKDYTVIYLIEYKGPFFSRRIESEKGVFDTLQLKSLLSKPGFKLKFFETD